MIDQRLLRTDLDGVKDALGRRGSSCVLADVDTAAQLDARLIDIAARRDAIRARVNTISKEVGQLRRDGNVDA
ncbi:MAG TPA: serine--tRNA ligase, partial [Ilumatobacteraceae bacterium]|nr:serine--tRNA ligase [Ilumatobacteraceae bacterium]